jgi:phenylacetic acid degradation operon negative regulatory protein
VTEQIAVPGDTRPAAADRALLPQPKTGTSPQHLVVTLLGDYWHGRREHLPSAALVQLLGEFAVSAVSARAALRRLVDRGVLESSRAGRQTYYGLTEQATSTILGNSLKITRFGAADRPWDGMWTIAVFSLPEPRRDARHRLRSRLRWLGFAALFDGVWVSPHATPDVVRDALADLRIGSATVLRATDSGGRPLSSAWALDELRLTYEHFIADAAPLLVRANGGGVGPAEALVARTRLMDVWRTLPALDPDLPAELLPPDWPRRRAHDAFAGLYDALGPVAEVRVKQVLAGFDANLPALVSHHTTRSLLRVT